MATLPGGSSKDGGAPWGGLVPFLLLFLREGGAPWRELSEEMERLGFEGLRSGEVYGVLREMEAEGMVASARDGGEVSPLWRRYEVTGAGEAYLKSCANSLARYRDETELFLRACAGGGRG